MKLSWQGTAPAKANYLCLSSLRAGVRQQPCFLVLLSPNVFIGFWASGLSWDGVDALAALTVQNFLVLLHNLWPAIRVATTEGAMRIASIWLRAMNPALKPLYTYHYPCSSCP